jgi:hypothetical protein
MKKLALLTLPLAILITAESQAQPKTSFFPGFHTVFTATVGAGILPTIKYLSQDGSIYNDPTTALECKGQICTFGVTDNNRWDSSGKVTYQIGDATGTNPSCEITIDDGALYPYAGLTSNCKNGATITPLNAVDNRHYTFTVNYVQPTAG